MTDTKDPGTRNDVWRWWTTGPDGEVASGELVVPPTSEEPLNHDCFWKAVFFEPDGKLLTGSARHGGRRLATGDRWGRAGRVATRQLPGRLFQLRATGRPSRGRTARGRRPRRWAGSPPSTGTCVRP
jgi:hypothetical protein